MSKNTKQSSPKTTHLAATTLANPNASQTAKQLAGSVLAQADKAKQTGTNVESKAAKVLHSEKYSDNTKSLAGSALSQSKKPK